MGERLRSATMRDRATLQDNDTFELSLKGLQAVSAIDLIIRATNGATMNQGNPIHLDVDTVEIVDGSKVIFSLSGVQVRALNAYHARQFPAATLDEQAAAVQEEMFTIPFGRWVGDPEYWFNPAMYQNPTLRVTVSFTISATVGFATGTGTLTVVGHVWDQAPAGRRGMFLTKEYKAYTSLASGEDRAELPRDWPYRMLFIRAFETAIAFDVDITQIKLTLDNDQYVPLDVRATQFRDLVGQKFPRFLVPQIVFRTDADAPQCFLAYPEEFSANALLHLDIASIDGRTIDQLRLQLLSVTVAPAIALSTTDTAIVMPARGLLPYFCGAHPFGDPMDPDSWFDVSQFGKFEAVLSQGGAGAAVSIFGQQVMS